MTRIILVREVGQERVLNLQITILQPYSLWFTLFYSTSQEEMEAPLRTCARLRRRIKKKCHQNISIINEWTRRIDNEFFGFFFYPFSIPSLLGRRLKGKLRRTHRACQHSLSFASSILTHS